MDKSKINLLIKHGFEPLKPIKMKPIKISLDVTKLDKDKFYKGEKGTYAKLSIVETPDNEYNTHLVFQDLGKDAKGEYIKSPILGGAKRWKDDSNSANNDLPF